jgi:UBX domain-containing protein 1/4
MSKQTMGLIELGSEEAVRDFLRQNVSCIVTFSAHWCGPCKASKPALENLAQSMSGKMKFGIVYENDLGEAIQSFQIRAFPTHVLYTNSLEVKRIEGANLSAVEEMAKGVVVAVPTTGGETLGGGGAVVSPAEARALRLAKLGVTAPAAAPPAPAPAAMPDVAMKVEDPPAKERALATKEDQEDVEMTDAATDNPTTTAEEPVVMIDPTEKLNPETIQILTESMGFALIRAQKGLLHGNGGTVEGAVEWLLVHQEDDDIDDPIEMVNAAAGVAKSYRCVATGKVFKNMADLELHAHRTGHSNFEESTESVKPLTEEEKAKKIAEIKVRVGFIETCSSKTDTPQF